VHLQAEYERLRDACPDDLRAAGWHVAIHNDYRQEGRDCTFWLLTRPRPGNPNIGDFVKGEGYGDAQALNQIRRLLRMLEQ